MERFRQLFNPSPSDAAQTLVDGRYVPAPNLVDPFLTRPDFVPNPAGASFTADEQRYWPADRIDAPARCSDGGFTNNGCTDIENPAGTLAFAGTAAVCDSAKKRLLSVISARR